MIFGPIPILFENSEFIAVDKPSGLSVHNNEDPQNVIKIIEAQMGLTKVYPVHRLDKETSGIQILALSDKPAKKLAEEFEQRRVVKIYTGVLRGQLKTTEGVWKQPLTDKAEGRRSPSGQPKDRVPCETGYKVVAASKYFTTCEFNLITGRQHQIRKHAALNEHALVGDPRYGDLKYNEKMAGFYKTKRMFLHCSRVEILGIPLLAPLPNEFAAMKSEA